MFGLGFLVRSFSPAEAAMQPPEKFIVKASDKSVKYMMAMSESVDEKAVYIHFLVRNTETGQSKLYKKVCSAIIEVVNSQLPNNPLSN